MLVCAGELGQRAEHVRADGGLGLASDGDIAPSPDLPQPLAKAGPGQVDDRRAQVRRRRLLAADGTPAAPGPDEGLLAQFLGQAPVTGQGKGQPHQLRIVTPVQLGQAIVAAGLHTGKTAAAPKRLPRTLSRQSSPPGGLASAVPLHRSRRRSDPREQPPGQGSAPSPRRAALKPTGRHVPAPPDIATHDELDAINPHLCRTTQTPSDPVTIHSGYLESPAGNAW